MAVGILTPFCWQYQDQSQRWYIIHAIYVNIYYPSLHKNELHYSFYIYIYWYVCILEYAFTLFYVLLLLQMYEYCVSNKLTIYYACHMLYVWYIIPHQNLHITVHQMCTILQFQCHIDKPDSIAILFICHRLFIVDSSPSHSLPSPLISRKI